MFRFKTWVWLHKWSSLICTPFLLVLCISGLPLIFRGEIDQALGYGKAAAEGVPAPLSAIEQAGLAAKPGWVVQYFVWEPDKPGVVTLSMARSSDASFYDNENVLVDAASARLLPGGMEGGPMETILTLHSQLFVGPWGPLVLGVPAILFIVALVSGIVVYGPFARRRPFGDIRRHRSKATRWLDLHNVAGAAILAWALVVGVTGLINCWGEYVIRIWQMTELSTYASAGSAGGALASLETVVAAAKTAIPEGTPYFVAYPHSLMGGEHFFAVYMRGDSALTQFMFQPVLIDAQSAQVIAAPVPPWYVQALALSQPLHFGDYGGMALKFVWAILDAAAIFVLGSGLYLTFRSGSRAVMPEPDTQASEAQA